MRRAVLPLVLVLLAVTGGVGGAWPDAAARTAAPSEIHAVTPLLSLRRIPRTVARMISGRRLTAVLDTDLADPAFGGSRASSCLVVADATGVLYARNPDLPLMPASNLKLLTAAAALRVLGPTYRFTTEVKGRIGPGGAVSDLWLVGGGDALLATSDNATAGTYQPHPYTPLEELARRVTAAGVRSVTGRVVGDDSRYDTQRYPTTLSAKYRADNEIGPLGALTVNGGFASWRPPIIPASDPAAEAASIFTRVLHDQGITVAATAASGTVPAGLPVIATITSLPLSDVIREMLRESDNFTAELMLKELGKARTGQGTTEAGLEVARQTLTSLGIPLTGVVEADGSGLAHSDRLTCSTVVDLLQHEGPDSPLGRALAVAGQGDGTLRHRFVGTPAAGRVHAKTGTLEGVSSLSGFVDNAGGELTFSLLQNGLANDALGVAMGDRIALSLVNWPNSPSLSGLTPEQAR